MVMLAGDVVTKTRKYLSDDNQITIFSDDEMIASLNRAQRNLLNARPELNITVTGTQYVYTPASALTDELLWPDQFLEALAQYSAFDKLSDDSHDRADREEAAYRLQLYQQEINSN